MASNVSTVVFCKYFNENTITSSVSSVVSFTSSRGVGSMKINRSAGIFQSGRRGSIVHPYCEALFPLRTAAPKNGDRASQGGPCHLPIPEGVGL